MSLKLRQDEILRILEKQGYVTVQYLSEILHYSTATINRDLNALQKQKLVTRSYGGVELEKNRSVIPLQFRYKKMRIEKRNIARVAASYIKSGDSVFIDASTTAQYMSQYLFDKKDIHVITNNMLLASQLSEYDVDTVCLGGRVVEAPGMLSGIETVENAMKYRVDKLFFSARSFSEDGNIASSSIYHVLNSIMLKNSKQAFFLADHEKLSNDFSMSLCSFSDVHTVISDYEFSEEMKKNYPSTEFVYVTK